MAKSIHSPQHQVLRELLIAARKRARMTQAEVAQKLGRPHSFVAKVEVGERRLDVVEFVALVSALGQNPVRLLTDLLKRM
jgi:hypothetical protein